MDPPRPELCRIPVIIFTCSSERIEVDGAYIPGANASLLKSVNHHNLVEALKKLGALCMDLNLHPKATVHHIAPPVPEI